MIRITARSREILLVSITGVEIVARLKELRPLAFSEVPFLGLYIL
jgi:hypothetical protein